ncbi:serine/arginine repetitive matrix protein 2-like [Culicoides brevitarsis]|uniref:serine/arginine repetitive matrix protein 2-like n=1 Tax=Culicoides brevitarsis TaxID=469753 RepID=UPI00307B4FD2
METCDDQSIRDAAKKRLKAMSEKKIVAKPTLSLYSDEELDMTEAKMDLNPKETEKSPKMSSVTDEVNGKRLYRMDRTLNTDSELSEGEIVDDDDDEMQVSKEISAEKVENRSEFPNNHVKFDLRQRIQSRFRGNASRGRFNNNQQRNFRRSRSRSRDKEHRSKDSKERKSSKRSSSRRSSGSFEGKSAKKKKEKRKSDEKSIELEKVEELTTLSADDDDFIKELKLKIKDLNAELHESVKETTPIEPVKKEKTPVKIEKAEKVKENDKNDKKRSRTSPESHSSREKKRERKRSRTRSRTPKASVKQKSEKSEKIVPKMSENASKVTENVKELTKECPKEKDLSKDCSKKEEKRSYQIKMSDGTVQEIPFALVKHTNTLPKITFSSRFNLKHDKSNVADDKKSTHDKTSEESKQLPSIKDTATSKKSSDVHSNKASDEKFERKDHKEKEKSEKSKSDHRKKSPERKKSEKSDKVEKKIERKSRERTPSDRKRTNDNQNRSISHSARRSRDRKESESKPKSAQSDKKTPQRDEKRRVNDNHRSNSRSRDTKSDKKSRPEPKNDHRTSLPSEKSNKHDINRSKRPSSMDKSSRNDQKIEKSSKIDEKKVKDEKKSSHESKEDRPRTSHRDEKDRKSTRDHRTPPKNVRKKEDEIKNESKKVISPIKDGSKSSTKPRQEQKLTLSFADELEEVQGLKPAKDDDDIFAPTTIKSDKNLPKSPVKEIKKEKSPLKEVKKQKSPVKEVKIPIPEVKREKSPIKITKEEPTRDSKKSEHAMMLKKIESNVSEILAPLSEFEKLAQENLKPEDFLNKIKDLFASEPKSDSKPAESLYEPCDMNVIDTKFIPEKPLPVKLESEYETFINSLTENDDTKEKEAKPKKISRSLSQSTNSSRTSGTTTTTTSTNNSSSDESSSSSDSDSSDSSSESDSNDEEEAKMAEKKLSSPSKTPPRELLPPKPDAVVSSTIDQTPVLTPLPEKRENPIKIQMNLIQKVYSLKAHMTEQEMPVFENVENVAEKKKQQHDESSKSRKRSRSRSKDRKSDRKSIGGDKKSITNDERKRQRTRSRSRDRRRDTRNQRGNSRDRRPSDKRRRNSKSPIRRRRSRDRSHRRSISRSPIRRNNRRVSSPRHRRPRSPRTPESPKNKYYSRSRSHSRSPLRNRRNLWNNRDYRRPPSPQSDTESPVAGFKRSLADSTISDAELEQQQLYKIQTHMTTEGFYSYEDPSLHHHSHHPHHSHEQHMPLHDSPRRLSLDDRINMALGGETSKYPYQEEPYRYNNYNPTQYPPHHHSQQLQYRYDPAVYNGPQPGGMDPHYPNPRYTNYHNNPPRTPNPQFSREPPMMMMPHQSNIKPVPQVSFHQHHPTPQIAPNIPAPQSVMSGKALQKGNMLEIVPTNIDLHAESRQENTPQQEIFGPQQEVKKKKLIFTAEELQSRKEKRLEMRKKRKAERDKKRLEKKMRKEKLKLEIKRLVSIGVKDEVLSSDEEDAPFDEIDRKGIYGTKDRGILKKKEETETKIVKKSVKFADGILPGDGSSYSDNDQNAEVSPNTSQANEKRKKKLKKRKKHPVSETTENKTGPSTELTPFPIELNIPPELEHAEPPPPPDGDPSPDLLQPRYLYPNRVPMLFFHLLRPSHYQPASHPPQHHSHPHAGHPSSINNAHQSPALHMNPQQSQQQQNKLPNSRVNHLPPTFANNRNLVENLQ